MHKLNSCLVIIILAADALKSSQINESPQRKNDQIGKSNVLKFVQEDGKLESPVKEDSQSQRLSNSNEDVSFGNQNEQVDDDDDEVYLRIRRSPKGRRGGGGRSSGGRSYRSGNGHSSTGRTSVGRRTHFQPYVRSLPSYPNIKTRSISPQFINHRIVNTANVHRTSTNIRRINSRINNHRRLPNIPNRSNFRRRISRRLPNTNTRGLNHPNYRDVEKKRTKLSAGVIVECEMVIVLPNEIRNLTPFSDRKNDAILTHSSISRKCYWNIFVIFITSHVDDQLNENKRVMIG
uniref:Cnidarian restricted protein n=1 Tax=Clytia hemisphaerica TaxID=252671 RepID=A0A7M5UYG5_9CNID